jgi:hypothetical protein
MVPRSSYCRRFCRFCRFLDGSGSKPTGVGGWQRLSRSSMLGFLGARLNAGMGCSGGTLDNVDRGRLAPSPPTQTGRAVLRHPAFQSVARDELAQALDSGFRKSRTSRAGLRPAHLDSRRSTIGLKSVSQRGFPRHPCAKPCGTARTLAGRMANRARYHIPAPLRSTVITRFFATTRALTPAGPFATGRGSLIHVTRTSEHSISNHLRTSASRVPLPLRWQPYFVGGFAGAMPARQFRRPNRVHFVPCTGNRRYGLLVHVQLLSTRGYGPGAVTFNYWPFSVGQVRDSHPAVQVRFQAHIARRFSAGYDAQRARVPKGRLKLNPTNSPRRSQSGASCMTCDRFNRPFGTDATLNGWSRRSSAGLLSGCPCGTTTDHKPLDSSRGAYDAQANA